MTRTFLLAFLAGGAALGCSSQTELPYGSTGAAADPTAVGVTPRLPYPAAPYGTKLGSVIENYSFEGWPAPAASGYDPGHLEAMSLANFYNPDGSKQVKYLVLTSTAVWCTACQAEYGDLATAKAASYRGKGVEFFGALFEDINSNPAKASDLKTWGAKYKVAFPFVLDPSLKLGPFFSLEETPMEMIVDTKTMTIVDFQTGWTQTGTSLWAALDQLLGK